MFAEKLITKIIKAEQISVRQIASIVGLIQSFKRALGSVTRMYTRRTYCWMAAKLEIGYYGSRYVLDHDVKEELMFCPVSGVESAASPERTSHPTLPVRGVSSAALFR